MPRKKDGMLFEIHPSPAKGKDGKSIVYVRPAENLKLSMKGLEDFCNRNYRSLYGEIERSFDYFLRAAGELMAMGYRIETPIGSFAPKLAMKREVTNADDVKDSDIMLSGVEFVPSKRWAEAIDKWLFNGFKRCDNPNTQELVKDTERLEQVLGECLRRGYVTARVFAVRAGLTLYSARKLLEAWTKGNNPKLLRTRMGHMFIYTSL